MKLCVFQGTFDPIHKAHLKIADYVAKNYDVDKILFIPAHKPPHKEYEKEMCEHRLNMVKLATKYNPKFEVSDIEYKRTEKSYTYDTIRELYKTYPIEGKIKFIIGTDAFEKINTWYKADELKKLVDFIVFPRENNYDKSKLNSLDYNWEIAQHDFQDISSSDYRKNQTKCLPTEVEEYIEEHGLYKQK